MIPTTTKDNKTTVLVGRLDNETLYISKGQCAIHIRFTELNIRIAPTFDDNKFIIDGIAGNVRLTEQEFDYVLLEFKRFNNIKKSHNET